MHRKFDAVLALFAVVSLTGEAGIVVYPEYDARIERDHAYEVHVSQGGGEKRRLTVYNHCEKSILEKRTRGGDVKLDFDLAVTELLSVFFCALTPCDELSFRSMSLIKIVDPHCAIITSRRSRGARQ